LHGAVAPILQASALRRSVAKLRDMTGSQTKDLEAFRQKRRAVAELQASGVIAVLLKRQFGGKFLCLSAVKFPVFSRWLRMVA